MQDLACLWKRCFGFVFGRLWILGVLSTMLPLLFTACAHKPQNLNDTQDRTDNAIEALLPQDLALDSSKIFLSTSQACKPNRPESALLSFVGDNVLGDYKGSAGATFNAKFKEVGEDMGYFSLGVREVLESDDLSIGNMEGVLSDKALKNAFDKPFSFKGSSRYTQILTTAGFEAMNVANNHSLDYGKQGFEDTIEHLRTSGLAVFGEGLVHIYEVNGIKFGLAGHRGWNLGIKDQVKREIQALRAQGADVVIFTFHWGEERKHFPNATQRALAHFTIDAGADMVIGHHPHVLQGVEEYKGKKIVYSLGNFIYGGAKNPSDKDSMIYQTRFVRFSPKIMSDEVDQELAKKEQQEFIEDLRFDTCAREAYLERAFIKGVERIDVLGDFVLIHSVIPVSISSTQSYNDYSPRIYEPDSKGFERILHRLESYSRNGARDRAKKKSKK